MNSKILMRRKELKKLCEEISRAIKSGRTECVEKTINKNFRHKRIEKSIYPDLDGLQFTMSDFNKLQKAGVIDKNQITQNALDYVIKKKDPLLKLLYCHCWKRGELKKLNNISEGIQNMLHGKPFNEDRESLVLYQFGRHIAYSSRREPLVDQHSIRAFRILRFLNKIKAGNEKQNLKTIRQMKLVENPDWVGNYVQWFNKLPNESQFRRAVDELLMVFGKAVKIGTRTASHQADA
jgi:hypothetical protein